MQSTHSMQSLSNYQWHRTRTKKFTIHMEMQRTPNSQSSIEKEEWSWRNQPFWLCFVLISLLFIFYLFFYFTILYWFCHTSTWICHGRMWVSHPEPHLPPCTIPPGHPSAPAPSIWYWTWTGDSFLIWYHTCFSAIPPNHPTLFLSHRVQKTVLYICVSFALLHTGLSLPSF